MTAPVFVVAPGSLDGLMPGGSWTLTGDEARHAASVQRLRAGEEIEVVDGAGVRLRGAVAPGADARAVGIMVAEVVRENPPATRLVLVQALAKGGRDEMAVEAATELGVDEVRPWQSERSVVQWRGEKVAKGEQRWRSLVHAASKVARRARLPEIAPFVRGDALVRVVADAVSRGADVLLLHEVASEPLVSLPPSTAPEILVVIGPEGGLSDREIEALVAAGGRPVLLGQNVLRASTAGPAALAVLSARTGRWG